ncbi:toxin Cry1Ac domain D-VI-related protein [Listeria monocytogenes]|uniref:toxin Cry1Ac domain D-VI-related protein n=1 Tax=Listeria monocytogenes TaxID=1639 RepID=UPI001F48EEB3|nr:toxin Cry1Ac domain D-VI-related protein [Listeria monocytogenes]
MMNKKRVGISLVSVCFVLLIAFVAFSINASHERAEEEKQKQKEEKIALDAKNALEKNTTNTVNELFADEKKTLLSDTYSVDDVKKIEDNIKKITNTTLKDKLNSDVDKAKQLYKSVEASIKQVESLFKDSKEEALAEGITRAKINEVNKVVKEKTPQNKAKKELENKVKKANDLIAKKEAQFEAKAKESNESDKSKINEQGSSKKSGNSSTTKRNDNSNSSQDTQTKSNYNNSGSNESDTNNSNSNPSSNTSEQPIVAKMNLASRTNQIITVVASGTSAQVKFWEKTNGNWNQIFSTSGKVGSQGVGSADEYHSRTPRGAYSLGFAFGTSNPGTSLPFKQITNNSYWISNVNDSQYNTWQERSSSNKADEHMASYPTQYRYGVVINYNTSRTKGAGSGFFLHCSNGAPTAGCVAIPTSHMATVLQKLHTGAYIVNVTSESELLNY